MSPARWLGRPDGVGPVWGQWQLADVDAGVGQLLSADGVFGFLAAHQKAAGAPVHARRPATAPAGSGPDSADHGAPAPGQNHHEEQGKGPGVGGLRDEGSEGATPVGATGCARKSGGRSRGGPPRGRGPRVGSPPHRPTRAGFDVPAGDVKAGGVGPDPVPVVLSGSALGPQGRRSPRLSPTPWAALPRTHGSCPAYRRLPTACSTRALPTRPPAEPRPAAGSAPTPPSTGPNGTRPDRNDPPAPHSPGGDDPGGGAVGVEEPAREAVPGSGR